MAKKRYLSLILIAVMLFTLNAFTVFAAQEAAPRVKRYPMRQPRQERSVQNEKMGMPGTGAAVFSFSRLR